MKKALLFLCTAAFAFACTKDLESSRDILLDGDKVEVEAYSDCGSKLFVLNEGGYGSNNSSLDFLRFSDGSYVRGAFRKMNPDVAGGLGDVGNDIAVIGNELWIAVNNSGIVQVVSAEDEKELAAIEVPMPRNIAFDDKYAYVTSWAGAYANGTYDKDGNYSITDSNNPKGRVYRIDLATKALAGSVEVGYQPEGIAFYDGKLYVANSGGISSQLPPLYLYDNTVSIIDASSFKLDGTVEVQVNLKNVYADGKGMIYVSSFGNYWDVHSGMYAFRASDPSRSWRIGADSAVKPEALNVSCSCICGDTVYCIGTPDEFSWGSAHSYSLWSYSTSDAASGKGEVKLWPLSLSGVPYGLTVLAGKNGDYMFVGDAGDYFNPGTVSAYDLSDGTKLWNVTAGVCPGHFAIW